MGERVGLNVKKPEVKSDNSDSRMRRTNHSQSVNPSVDSILFLQRTVGNRAVQRLLRSGALQAKLRIGQPGDVYEQEADRVADEVMRMPEPQVQRQADLEEEEEEILQTKLLVDQITPLVQRQVEEEEEEEMLQAKSREDGTSEVTNDLESQINAIKGGGRPLAESERAYFEPRFGYDFGHVRVHTDAQAAESARMVNARAFTVGHDVVFGKGEYAPATVSGLQLLAHELVHSVQQSKQSTWLRAESSRQRRNSEIIRLLPYNLLPELTPMPNLSLYRIQIQNCNPSGTPPQNPDDVSMAHQRAYDMLTNAISRSSSNTTDVEVQNAVSTYFKITIPLNSFADRNRWDRVEYYLNRFDELIDHSYKCKPQATGLCSGNTAWTGLRINLCPSWWTSYPNVNERAGILIHEWAHAVGMRGRIGDIICHDPDYADLPSRRLVTIPDAYMQYLYRLYTHNPWSC